MVASIKIACTFVPVRKFNLLLPNSAIAEVIVSQSLEKKINSPQWLLGTTQWQNEEIDIIGFDKIDSSDDSPENLKSIIIIVRNPSITGAMRHFGIMTKNRPHIVEANSHTLDKNLHPRASHSHAKSYVVINGKEALIPNIELLAKTIEENSPH